MTIDNNTKIVEDREWIDSLQWIVENESKDRAGEILDLLQKTADAQGIRISKSDFRTDYVNTINVSEEVEYPGEVDIEERITNAIRWNAMAMVVNANRQNEGIGGHISTYASASNLFEVGFQHFFRGYDDGEPDIVYFQGHASPGIYARSYLEYRLDEEDLEGFRNEISSENGLPSYPHPQSMPEYWRYPTVSMGLAPIQAIYKARFLKYLQKKGMMQGNDQKVWVFVGDGEMDEPESKGALTIAARENLDNLIFVVNCNLQRLDGPVRGNNKIVTELEGTFKGSGWNVLKVLWDSQWDELLKHDENGALRKRLGELPDGEIQRWAQMKGGERREAFFNLEPDIKKIADQFDDDFLEKLGRGGHDVQKIYNAYKKAIATAGKPSVVLAQTVKGYRQRSAGEASNVTHKIKKLDSKQLKKYRDVLDIPFSDEDLEKEQVPFYRFNKDDENYKYLKERRRMLHGWLPERKILAREISMPEEKVFKTYYEGSGKKEVTTTSVLIQLIAGLLKDENIGKHIVPIIPDESRTFGLDAIFSNAGIYAPEGQQYEPVDKGSLIFYNEEEDGAIVEEGITEAGAMSTFIASGNIHLVRDVYTIPFYLFYSMFGFQRIGDLIWAAGDAGVKGFMIGGIAGRTSLSGEGLQHADGQSHLYAMAYPNIRAYDPAFAFELAVIVRDGIQRMYKDGEEVMYYITIANQGYPMPKKPANVEEGIIKGLYLFKKSRKRKNKSKTVNLLGSGALMEEVIEAARILEKEYDIPANIWSVTSYKALYDDAVQTDDDNIRRKKQRKNFIQKNLSESGQVFVAATDYLKAMPLSIAKWIPGHYDVLGTDGYGKSDDVDELRKYFNVNATQIVRSALNGLVNQDKLNKKVLEESMAR